MTDRELMQMALDALRKCTAIPTWPSFMPVIKDLEARLAQPEPEPVAWMHDSHVGFNVPLYTASPQREWQGLTAKDLAEIPPSCYEGAIWADAKLKEKNSG